MIRDHATASQRLAPHGEMSTAWGVVILCLFIITILWTGTMELREELEALRQTEYVKAHKGCR
jgi:hypothetical protein